MNNIHTQLWIILIIFMSVLACEKEEPAGGGVEKSIQEEILEISENEMLNERASSFGRLLKSASIGADDSSKVTVFAVVDHPYSANATSFDDSYLENHIVKGTYRLKDFGPNTKLETVNGKSLTIRNVDPEDANFWINETESCGLNELEVNGNIIHLIYSPVFSDRDDLSAYLEETKKLFAEFVEYCYCFDAVLTDAAGAVDVFWDEIDQHTFGADNAKIEKLWFDAYGLINRCLNLSTYSTGASDDIFAENNLIQAFASIQLWNYFGGIPICNHPAVFNEQLSRANKEEVFSWIVVYLDLALSIAEGNQLGNTARALMARISFQNEGFESILMGRTACDDIIRTGDYLLENELTTVYSQESTESIYWVNNLKQTGSELSESKAVLPVCRLSETYLMGIYFKVEEGLMVEANNLLKRYQEKKGYEVSGFPTPNEMRVKLREYLLADFPFDGNRFAIIKKLGIPGPELGMPEYKDLLPIPLTVLDYNPNIVQNP